MYMNEICLWVMYQLKSKVYVITFWIIMNKTRWLLLSLGNEIKRLVLLFQRNYFFQKKKKKKDRLLSKIMSFKCITQLSKTVILKQSKCLSCVYVYNSQTVIVCFRQTRCWHFAHQDFTLPIKSLTDHLEGAALLCCFQLQVYVWLSFADVLTNPL